MSKIQCFQSLIHQDGIKTDSGKGKISGDPDEATFFKALGINQSRLFEQYERKRLHPVIFADLILFGVLKVGLLLSVPPVVLGRWASYLPTTKKRIDIMFQPLPAYSALKNLQAIMIY